MAKRYEYSGFDETFTIDEFSSTKPVTAWLNNLGAKGWLVAHSATATRADKVDVSVLAARELDSTVSADLIAEWKRNTLAVARYHKKHCDQEDCGVVLCTLKQMAKSAGVVFDDEDFSTFM